MIRVADEVREALAAGAAVVALETTLVAHGFPAGEGVAVALESERRIRSIGAVPATIGVLAWVLATCPEDAVRDGHKAIDVAKKACELSRWKDANQLRSLAAAYAESGNFKEAVRWEETAIKLGYADREEGERARERFKLYEEGKPYREE